MFFSKTGLFLIFLMLGLNCGAQTIKLQGRVSDANTSEACQGAVVRVLEESNLWAVSNQEGEFALQVPATALQLEVSYVGYASDTLAWNPSLPTILDVALVPLAYSLSPVTVLGETQGMRLRKPEMSLEKMDQKIIKKVPVLLGEKDLVKVIQLLPGVNSTSEGSSAFNVRGGSPDQNLVLWDEASLYNISHMLGFFSIFNNDAVSNMALYKGDIPAAYGGRLSSLLNVEAKTGSPTFAVNGGIGLIASRLSVEGNMGTPNLTFLASGRRTYADMFLPFFPNETVRTTRINFYDANAKIHWRAGKKDYVSLTFYNGRDRFKAEDTGVNYGNTAATLSWRHTFSSKWFLKTSLVGSRYAYEFLGQTESLLMKWKANIRDAMLRLDATYLASSNIRLQMGWTSDFQWFRPGNASGTTTVQGLNVTQSIEMSNRQSFVNTLYASVEHRFLDNRLNLRYGLRLNRFDAVGPTTFYTVDENYNLVEPQGESISSGDFFYHHYSLEPRLGISYTLNDEMSVKASYARTVQYTHLLSFSSAGSPLEIWVPTNPSIRPQTANQFSAGYFYNLLDGQLETSAELFYKRLDHVMDYKDHPDLLLYDKLETELRFGKGEAYGVELMVKKPQGRLSGWLSYTYSRSFRTIADVNDNLRYNSPSDRPHSIALVAFFELNKRWSFSMNWVYATGQAITLPDGRYWFNNELVPVYSHRNAYRLPDYHRLDLSATVALGKMNRRFSNELNFSVYNAYGRKNPWAVNNRLRPSGEQYLQMTYLFSCIPSITWNFKF